MKAKQIAILLALRTMMIAGCGSNTKNADSQTEVSTSTEMTDEASSDETDTEETDSNSGETANEATDSQQEAADPGDGNYEDNPNLNKIRSRGVELFKTVMIKRIVSFHRYLLKIFIIHIQMYSFFIDSNVD